MPSNKCKRCNADIFWAKHERTGKSSPLCRPPEGMPANIELVSHEQVPNDPHYTTYRIVAPGNGEFISHFSNCKYAKEFRG